MNKVITYVVVDFYVVIIIILSIIFASELISS